MKCYNILNGTSKNVWCLEVLGALSSPGCAHWPILPLKTDEKQINELLSSVFTVMI